MCFTVAFERVSWQSCTTEANQTLLCPLYRRHGSIYFRRNYTFATIGVQASCFVSISGLTKEQLPVQLCLSGILCLRITGLCIAGGGVSFVNDLRRSNDGWQEGMPITECFAICGNSIQRSRWLMSLMISTLRTSVAHSLTLLHVFPKQWRELARQRGSCMDFLRMGWLTPIPKDIQIMTGC